MSKSSKKALLRSIARKRRQQFVASLSDPHWKPAGLDLSEFLYPDMIMASYRAIHSEADPTEIDAYVCGRGGRCAYPRLDDDSEMRFYCPSPSQTFEPGPFGIDEPSGDLPAVVPTIILLPLLAFDRSGTRLGQGGGHYDRALAALSRNGPVGRAAPLRVGVAWSVQEMEDIPRDMWDMPLDMIVTEREWIRI